MELKEFDTIWCKLRKEDRTIQTGLKWLDDILKRHKNQPFSSVVELVEKEQPNFNLLSFLIPKFKKSNGVFGRYFSELDESLKELSFGNTMGKKELDKITLLAHSATKNLCAQCGLNAGIISKDELFNILKKQVKAYERKRTADKTKLLLDVLGKNFKGLNSQPYEKELSETLCFEIKSFCEKKLRSKLKMKLYQAKKAKKEQESKLAKAYMKRAKNRALWLVMESLSKEP